MYLCTNKHSTIDCLLVPQLHFHILAPDCSQIVYFWVGHLKRFFENGSSLQRHQVSGVKFTTTLQQHVHRPTARVARTAWQMQPKASALFPFVVWRRRSAALQCKFQFAGQNKKVKLCSRRKTFFRKTFMKLSRKSSTRLCHSWTLCGFWRSRTLRAKIVWKIKVNSATKNQTNLLSSNGRR